MGCSDEVRGWVAECRRFGGRQGEELGWVKGEIYFSFAMIYDLLCNKAQMLLAAVRLRVS